MQQQQVAVVPQSRFFSGPFQNQERRIVRLDTMLTILSQDYAWNFSQELSESSEIPSDGSADRFIGSDHSQNVSNWEGQNE